MWAQARGIRAVSPASQSLARTSPIRPAGKGMGADGPTSMSEQGQSVSQGLFV